MEWLKRRKLDIMKPGEMWVALASAGVEHGVYKGHNFQVEIWYCEPPEITKRERFLEAEDF
jgi:hypothetical protein